MGITKCLKKKKQIISMYYKHWNRLTLKIGEENFLGIGVRLECKANKHF